MFCRQYFLLQSKNYQPLNLYSISRQAGSVRDLLESDVVMDLGRSASSDFKSFQVIGSSRQGFPSSIILRSNNSGYLFNCGSGFLRSFSNRDRKFPKLNSLKGVFLTSTSWDRIEGLPGICITNSITSQPVVQIIHGPVGTKQFLNLAKRFVHYVFYDAREYQKSSTYTDPDIHINIIPLASYRTDFSDTKKRLKIETITMAYIVRLACKQGKLDPKKCKELKLPVGPILRELKSGKDVVLDDNRLIRSVDVCEPNIPGENLLIVECSALEDIDTISNNNTIQQSRNNRYSNNQAQIDFVLHFTPKEVYYDEKYQLWLKGFSQECLHFPIDHVNDGVPVMPDVYSQQYLLNRIDSQLYPLLHDTEQYAKVIDKNTTDHDDFSNPERFFTPIEIEDKTISMDAFDVFSLPSRKIYKPTNPPVSKIYNALSSNTVFSDTLKAHHKKANDVPKPMSYEPEVIFLGTASACPTKYKNVSSILVNFSFPKQASVILDCGENTYGQILRLFGAEKTKEKLRRLKLIYISHLHLDHQLGLGELIYQRGKVSKEPLVLLVSPPVSSMIEHINQSLLNANEFCRIYYTNAFLTKKTDASVKSQMLQDLDGLIEDIVTVDVVHCFKSVAGLFKFKIGHPDMKSFSLAYSGDCRPCDEFVDMALNCDLLIHEATFTDEENDTAILKKHSTYSEAIQVSKRMKAKFALLTHFSAKISKMPPYNSDDINIGLAFDYLRVRCPSDYKRLTLVKEILAETFKDSLMELETKFIKKMTSRKLLLK